MTTENSIFNLISLFTGTKKNEKADFSKETHCSQKGHHDFYCEAERPFSKEFISAENPF